MKAYLKVKIKSLAAEAKIIRREEKRYPGGHAVRIGLYLHRIHEVRDESRSAHLAYGFLKGRTYSQIEQGARKTPDWSRIERLIHKYGEGDMREINQRFAEWKSEQT